MSTDHSPLHLHIDQLTPPTPFYINLVFIYLSERRIVNALRHWSRQASASSSAAVTLSRLARHHHSGVVKEALFRWRCAVARAREELSEDRMAVAETSLAREKGRARRAAAAALLGALRRDRRRSLVWGFGVFEEQRLVFEKKARMTKTAV